MMFHYFWALTDPLYDHQPVDQAARWTWDFFEQNDVSTCKDYPTQMIIGETGWPTDADSVSLSAHVAPPLSRRYSSTFYPIF